MKKALAILMVLAMVTGVAFAADAPKTFGNESVVAVTGNATLSWGIDLNEDGTSGFKNETDWKISIPLLAKQTYTKTGKDNYAEIKIKDVQFNLLAEDGTGKDKFEYDKGDKKIGGVEAKLVFGSVYVTVYEGPKFITNQALLWAPIKNDKWTDNDTNVTFEPGNPRYGSTKIGYKAEKFDIGLKLGSLNYAKDPAAPVAEEIRSKYAFGIDATLTPSDMVTAFLTFNNAMWEGSAADPADSIMSVGAKVTVKPIKDLTAIVAFDGGNDYMADGESAFAYDALVSAAYKYAEAGFYYSSVGTPYVATMLSVDADGAPVADGSVYFKVMDGGAVPNLSASFTFMLTKLLSDTSDTAMPMAFGLDVNYKHTLNDVNYVKPFAKVWGENDTLITGVGNEADMAMAFEFGADYGLFSNAVITAKYVAGKLKNNDHLQLIDKAAFGNEDADLDDKGLFSLAVKVNY